MASKKKHSSQMVTEDHALKLDSEHRDVGSMFASWRRTSGQRQRWAAAGRISWVASTLCVSHLTTTLMSFPELRASKNLILYDVSRLQSPSWYDQNKFRGERAARLGSTVNVRYKDDRQMAFIFILEMHRAWRCVFHTLSYCLRLQAEKKGIEKY